MDFKNSILCFILSMVFILSPLLTDVSAFVMLDYTKTDSSMTWIWKFYDARDCTGKDTIQITSYYTKELVEMCYENKNHNGKKYWFDTTGLTYEITDGKLYYIEQKTFEKFEGKNTKPVNIQTPFFVQDMQQPIEKSTIIPDNSLRSWINLTNSESEPVIEPNPEPESKRPDEEKTCEDTKRQIASSQKYRGVVEACLYDYEKDIWIDTDGNLYQHDKFDNFVGLIQIEEKPCNGAIPLVMKRDNCHYTELVDHVNKKATNYFNASLILTQTKPSFSHTFNDTTMFDCEGSIVSVKYLECSTKNKLIEEQKKAIKLFNATTLEKELSPSTTHVYPDMPARKKFAIENNMMWIWGQYDDSVSTDQSIATPKHKQTDIDTLRKQVN